jgi:transposase
VAGADVRRTTGPTSTGRLPPSCRRAREGQILLYMPLIGPIQAASIIATIGHIGNFPSTAARRADFGWAPRMKRSGATGDQAKLTRSGTRTIKQMLHLIVDNAI